MTRVTALDVRCATCGAAPGLRCRKLTDASAATAAHPRRRKLASEEQARLNPEHVRGQLPLWGKVSA